MFSTSMIASSTTTPMATAKPPRVIVFSATPKARNTITAASNESGIDKNEMNAVRGLRKKSKSTITTNTAPMASELPMWPSAISIKFAGRCRPPCSVMPCLSRVGWKSASALSTRRVTSRVFVPYWLVIANSTPGLPMINASPNFGDAAFTTSATSRMRIASPPLPLMMVEPSTAGSENWPAVSTSSLWLAVSM